MDTLRFPSGTSRFLAPTLLVLVLLAPGRVSAQGSSLLPLDRGEVVMTHSSMMSPQAIDTTHPVVRLFDVRNPNATGDVPPNGSNFPAPAYPPYFSTGTWTANQLGQVFALALDDAAAPNIYVAAASLYGIGQRPSPGTFLAGQFGATPGTIFKIDGTTGAVSVFATVLSGWCDGNPRANTGPAIAQIAFDPTHKQLFASDLDDGVIYRIATAGHTGNPPPGTLLSCFDHGRQALPVISRPAVLDDGSSMDPNFSSGSGLPTGFTPLERRVAGVGVSGNVLYYSTWREDAGRPASAPVSNEVFSVPLNPTTGDFVASGAQLEFALPDWITPYSNPVFDIALSADDRMLLAERTMRGDVGPGQFSGAWAHESRVLEYRLSGATWVPEPVGKHQVGNTTAANSAGGVDWNGQTMDLPPDPGACDSTVVASGDGLNSNAPAPGELYIYGMQIHPATGGNPDFSSGGGNALFVDWDNDYLVGGNPFYDKISQGDVEAFGPECEGGSLSCLEFLNFEIVCLGDGVYQVSFQVVNNSPFSVPAGGIRIFLPDGSPVITLPLTTNGNPGVPAGQTSDPVTFTFTSGGAPGDAYCFTYQLIGLDTDGNGFPQWSCEKTTYCVVLPECPPPCLDLGEVIQDWRRVFGVNGVFATLTLSHSGPSPAGHVAVTPLNPGVAVTGPTLTPTPLPPNTPGTVQFIYAGPGVVPGRTLKFRIDIHDCDDLHNGFCEWCCTAVLEIVVPPRTLLDGVVFADRDGDGLRGAYEEPLAGWRVTARHGATLLGEARTDADGAFVFDVPLGTGAVAVTVEPAAGWTTPRPDAAVECDLENGCPVEPLLFAASDGAGALPAVVRLEATYPNPFSTETTIRFTLPEAAAATLRVFDVLGREVARLVDGEFEAGRHHVVFDASALPNGVYVVQLAAGGQVAAQRVTLLR